MLALILLTDSRRDARASAGGELIPLEEQDRSLWDRRQILDSALALRAPGPYQTQAVIAALHAVAATPEATDWIQMAALYRALFGWTPSPVVDLNAAVAHGLAPGIEEVLPRIAALEAGGELERYHLLPAAKTDLLRRIGRHPEAAAAYMQALQLVTNPTERRFLERRLAVAGEAEPYPQAGR